MKKLGRIIKVIGTVSFIGGVIAAVMDLLQRRTAEKKARETGFPIHKTYGMYERYFKRFWDFFLSGIAVIVLSPVMIITAVLVRIKLGSPIFFIQNRPGKDESIFPILKFRTMTDEKDREGKLLPDEERLTSFGKMLRSTSLDELPELFNILKGDMSIVGPRPLLVQYLPRYSEEQRHRHDVRPGFTGLAQVNGRNAISWEEKFEWDVKYVEEISFWRDIQIIWKTVGVVFHKSGISSETSATMEEFTGSEKLL